MSIAFFSSYSIMAVMAVLYCMLSVTSLGLALVLTLTPERPSHSQLRDQVKAWWFIFPLVTLALVFYPIGPIMLTWGINGLVIRELSIHFAGPARNFRLLCTVVFILMTILIYFQIPYMGGAFFGIIVIQLIHFFWQKNVNQLLILLFLLSNVGCSFIIQLMRFPMSAEKILAWLFYLFVVTSLNDIAQFIFGKIFGKHRIAHIISPNKTWEGLVGGVSATLFLSLILGNYLQLASANGLFSLGLLLSLGGFAGDLLFSMAKRFLCIKDFSQLIPGHGGILDRVDSLTMTAPLLYFALYFRHLF